MVSARKMKAIMEKDRDRMRDKSCDLQKLEKPHWHIDMDQPDFGPKGRLCPLPDSCTREKREKREKRERKKGEREKEKL